jgi:hypothetical protein
LIFSFLEKLYYLFNDAVNHCSRLHRILFIRINPQTYRNPQMPRFVAPVWNATESHYDIHLTDELSHTTRLDIAHSSSGSTIFSSNDALEQVSHDLITVLLREGEENKWFSKLPTHASLMKRVNHTFKQLATSNQKHAVVTSILMTPKTLMLVWLPITYAEPTIPGIGFDSDSDSDLQSEPEIADSNLPPVPLTDVSQQTQEEYLLTRLRAAKARLEAEHIRMEYFETMGRMPPDSDSEEEE